MTDQQLHELISIYQDEHPGSYRAKIIHDCVWAIQRLQDDDHPYHDVPWFHYPPTQLHQHIIERFPKLNGAAIKRRQICISLDNIPLWFACIDDLSMRTYPTHRRRTAVTGDDCESLEESRCREHIRDVHDQRAAVITIAKELYRRRTGVPPTSTAQLVPTELPAIPIDPFTHAPFP